MHFILHLIGACGDNQSHIDLLDLRFLIGDPSAIHYHKNYINVCLKCVRDYLRDLKIKYLIFK